MTPPPADFGPDPIEDLGPDHDSGSDHGDGTDRDVDVLIVGAGLSGIGAAARLAAAFPDRRYAILEARADTGGTWDTFRYPGVRSDSDMHTLGYPFRPWAGPDAIADGERILSYLRETAAATGVDRHIHTATAVVSASWSSATARWTVRTAAGQEWTAAFLHLCCGYYDHDRPHTPDLPGLDAFAGTVVHPQHWPADLDVTGARVVVVGSGATAISMVPALAARAGHVTMLQRSPSWLLTVPRTDPPRHRGLRLPAAGQARLRRWRNAASQQLLFSLSRRRPAMIGRWLSAGMARELPDPAALGLDPAVDLRPRYAPWDQRLGLVAGGDLFAALRARTASLVTDRIVGFDAHAVRLASGREVPADVLVTATGLRLLALGGIQLDVDGAAVAPGERLVWRGCLLSDVPNLAITVGYVYASWTLRADLTARWLGRLWRAMDAGGWAVVVPRPHRTGAAHPLLDLRSGYVARGAADLPHRGSRGPWRFRSQYFGDVLRLRFGPVLRGLERHRAPTASPSGASSPPGAAAPSDVSDPPFQEATS